CAPSTPTAGVPRWCPPALFCAAVAHPRCGGGVGGHLRSAPLVTDLGRARALKPQLDRRRHDAEVGRRDRTQPAGQLTASTIPTNTGEGRSPASTPPSLAASGASAPDKFVFAIDRFADRDRPRA